MKLTVFQSSKGDCLLLAAGETRILVDGGMRGSYSEHVAPALGALRDAGKSLDVVYLSHIDEDHVGGVLRMLDDELEWRVHDFQLGAGNADHRPPANPRPPKIGDLWHNGFREFVDENAGEIEELLAAKAGVLEASAAPKLIQAAARHRDIATSVTQAIELSHRLSPEQLGISLNGAFGKELALRREGLEPLELGLLKLTLLGPTADDLDELREEWNNWLDNEKASIASLLERMRRDAGLLAAGEAITLRPSLDADDPELSDRAAVTVPNLASLMFLVEEDDRRLLLTGDGHARDIEVGLQAVGALDDDQGRIHVEVLKVQHHGSEHNLDPAFCRRVSADNYVYCANGSDENPDLHRLRQLLDSRLGSGEARNTHPKAERPFTMWVNNSSKTTSTETFKEHMRAVERIVEDAAEGSGGRMDFHFLEDHSFELQI